MTTLILLCIVFGAYFLPSIWAYYVNHKKKETILIINLFLGWTFVGWVVALAWSGTQSK
jgi:hypothetical protein